MPRGKGKTQQMQRIRHMHARAILLAAVEASGLSATAYAKTIGVSHTAVLLRLRRARAERALQAIIAYEEPS